MIVAADYPFLEVLWTMLVFFAWILWFWLLIYIASDVFRRRDIGGGKKAVWLIFMIFAPFVGVITYLIVNGDGMTERRMSEARAQQAQFDDYVRSVAEGGRFPAVEETLTMTPAPRARIAGNAARIDRT